jgi:hypothetical protein
MAEWTGEPHTCSLLLPTTHNLGKQSNAASGQTEPPKPWTVNCNLTLTVEVGVERWTCSREWDGGKELISQPHTNVGKATEDESRSRGQPNFPKELLTSNRDWEKHKGWGREWGNMSTSQNRIPELISGTESSIQKWIVPICWGRSWPNWAAAATWWKQQIWAPCRSWQSYLTSPHNSN